MHARCVGFAERLQAAWFAPRRSALVRFLLPLSALFALLSALRRTLYRGGMLRSTRLRVPVVVVGNILVGGTGKTPLVLWLVDTLRAAGRRPGIVLRGYRGGSGAVLAVDAQSDPALAGDEAVLLARRSGVPVFAARSRVAAGEALLAAHPAVDVIVADDGLQHYALARDVELAVFDRRGAGNGLLLPAGPLREPVSRLARVDAVVGHADGRAAWQALAGRTPAFALRLAGETFLALHDPSRRRVAADFAADCNAGRLVAIAGTGSPQRFFDTLQALGLVFEARAFPDHHAYCAADLEFARGRTLLMTEKDAVKCAALPLDDAWVLPVSAVVETSQQSLIALVLEKIDGRPPA